MSERPIHILVVEDEADLRAIFQAVLEGAGYDVEVVPDGQAGLEAIEKRRPDLLVTDLLTPRMHGYELIRKLRSTHHGVRLPIIVVSGQAYSADQRKAIELGAARFLAKPFRRRELLDMVERSLSSVRVRFWGVRGSIAAPGPETIRYGGNTPCVTVERGRDMLILDAGTGLRKLGLALQAEANGTPQHLHMLITHTHWDHIQGFPFFVPAYVPGNHLDIHGPPSVEKPLEKVIRGQMDPAYFPVALGDMAARIDVHEIREPEFEVGPFKVKAKYINHPGITMAYRIELDGTVITYATDTEPYRYLLADTDPHDDDVADYGGRRDTELIEFARDADLYIADSQYTPAEYEKKRGWGHTCYLDAVELALSASAKRVALFSHDPMHDDDMIDQKLADSKRVVEERGADLSVFAAVEGQALEIEAPREE